LLAGDMISLDGGTAAYEYYIRNTMLGPVDGEILYCMIRNFKPRKIVEIVLH